MPVMTLFSYYDFGLNIVLIIFWLSYLFFFYKPYAGIFAILYENK
jgi:hypothetical protein